MLRSTVFRAGAWIRNPKILRRLEELRTSERWPRERLLEDQGRALAALVRRAEEQSPFYRERFRAAGVRAADIRTVADLAKLPTVDKADLLAHKADIQLGAGLGKLFFSETSGSTGEPLTFYRHTDWDAATRAAMFRGYAWHGVRPWERNGLLWGYDIHARRRRKIQLLDELQNRFRLFTYDVASIRAFARRLAGARYLEGYSSMVYEVAKAVNREGLGGAFQLAMVKGTSETIFPGYQPEGRRAFGRKLISEYGSTETGIIAYECPHESMHVAMENVILEVVDGQAVVTNLFSQSFPILRYRLGDVLTLDPERRCACGMEHDVVASVEGRVGRVVHGRARTYPSFTFYYVFKNIAMTHGHVFNYQAVQDRVGELELRVEGGLDAAQRALVETELVKYFGDDLTWTISDAPRIREPGKKLRDFLSRVED